MLRTKNKPQLQSLPRTVRGGREFAMTDDWDWRERKMYEMYDAVMAGDRDKAVELMRDLFPHYAFRSVAEQRNLFPDRVPA